MTQEITKDLQCISMRNGAEVWIENDRVEKLKRMLQQITNSTFIELPDGQVVNTADIVGIFSAKDMELVNRKKQGQWQDSDGNWHNRGDYQCSQCKNIVPKGMKCGNCAI